MSKKTPPLNAKGIYQLKTPWVISDEVIYTCKAIRSFRDIYELGEDVYTVYYEPKGISTTDFNNDVLANANIITLMADSYNQTEVGVGGSIIYVPDTYILGYPDQSNIPYSHVVLSLSFSAIPDGLDLSAVKTQMANVASDVIGLVPVVNEHRAATTGLVTPQEHADNETARLGAITLVDTDYARMKQLEEVNLLQQEQIASLIAYCEANSIWPPP